MKYMATFIQAHTKAVSEAALLGWWHHINAGVSVPALPQHVPFHNWEAEGFLSASPSQAMGNWGQPPVPALPPHTNGGTQLHSLGVRRQRWRSTAKASCGQLFCRPGVGSETANCSSALALPQAQRLRDMDLSPGVRAHQHVTHLSSHPQPKVPPWAPVPGAAGDDGEFAGAGAEVTFHRAITEMGPANLTSWIRPGLGQSKAIWSDWLL